MTCKTMIQIAPVLFAAVVCQAAAPALQPAIQTDLRALASAANVSEQQSALARVRQIVAANRTEFIQQLAYFTRDADNEREAMLAGAVVRELAIPDDAMIKALVPLLETDDGSLKAQVGNMLGTYEDLSADRPPDFSTYREMIAAAVRENADPPLGLVEHMYDTDPGQALLTMLRASGFREPQKLREVLWAEHVVADMLWRQRYGFLNSAEVDSDAITELQGLAEHDQWWARLYVAAILDRHRNLQLPGVVERLIADEHNLVASYANRLSKSAAPTEP